MIDVYVIGREVYQFNNKQQLTATDHDQGMHACVHVFTYIYYVAIKYSSNAGLKQVEIIHAADRGGRACIWQDDNDAKNVGSVMTVVTACMVVELTEKILSP